jgi:hypothetical protein
MTRAAGGTAAGQPLSYTPPEQIVVAAPARVVGPSGAGKSWFVRAGIVPALEP